MLTGFFTILRMIWPFLKESIFGRASFKAWVRSNISTCLWMILLVTMLVVVLYLVGILSNENKELTQTRQADQTLTTSNARLLTAVDYYRNLGTSLTQELDWTRQFVNKRCQATQPLVMASIRPLTAPIATRRSNHNQQLIEQMQQWDSIRTKGLHAKALLLYPDNPPPDQPPDQ
jgi:hypothetical protein